MLAAEVALAAAGLYRYEVANYAQPGHESAHNTVYWTGGAYLGLGPAAASMLPWELFARVAEAERWDVAVAAAAPARARFTRGATFAEYVRTPLATPGPIETLTAEEAAREDVMLGLRTSEGVPVAQAAAAGVAGVLERLATQGLVRRGSDAASVERWYTTQSGWLLGNVVFGAVWSGE
jgi:oxygen-independent coproporphyrinogen III oxidase